MLNLFVGRTAIDKMVKASFALLFLHLVELQSAMTMYRASHPVVLRALHVHVLTISLSAVTNIYLML